VRGHISACLVIERTSFAHLPFSHRISRVKTELRSFGRLPASGLPSRFILDTKTNSYAFSEIQPLTGDGDALYNIVLLSFIMPVIFSTFFCILSAYFLGKWVKETRRTRLLHENVILNVVQQVGLAVPLMRDLAFACESCPRSSSPALCLLAST